MQQPMAESHSMNPALPIVRFQSVFGDKKKQLRMGMILHRFQENAQAHSVIQFYLSFHSAKNH